MLPCIILLPCSGNIGHLILLSGKTGNELMRKEIDRTYFMPQIFKRNNKWFVVYGTGGPVTGGSLHLSPLATVTSENSVTRQSQKH